MNKGIRKCVLHSNHPGNANKNKNELFHIRETKTHQKRTKTTSVGKDTGKRNPYLLLVGILTGLDFLENNMDMQKY